MQVIKEYWEDFPVLGSRSLFVIYFVCIVFICQTSSLSHHLSSNHKFVFNIEHRILNSIIFNEIRN